MLTPLLVVEAYRVQHDEDQGTIRAGTQAGCTASRPHTKVGLTRHFDPSNTREQAKETLESPCVSAHGVHSLEPEDIFYGL